MGVSASQVLELPKRWLPTPSLPDVARPRALAEYDEMKPSLPHLWSRIRPTSPIASIASQQSVVAL